MRYAHIALIAVAFVPMAPGAETLEYRSSRNAGFEPSYRKEAWRSVILIGKESLLLCEQLARALQAARTEGDRSYTGYFELIRKNRNCYDRQGRLCSQLSAPASRKEKQLFFQFVEILKAQGRAAFDQLKKASAPGPAGFTEPGLKELQELNLWHRIDRETLQSLMTQASQDAIAPVALYSVYMRSVCGITGERKRCDLLAEYFEGAEFQAARQSLPEALQ